MLATTFLLILACALLTALRLAGVFVVLWKSLPKVHFDHPLKTLRGYRVIKPSHGPQIWPAWRLFSLSLVKLTVHPPSTGHRLWIYSRWGAIHFDLFFDRRDRWWAR